MEKPVLIIQRFYYSFREGFFEYLTDTNFNFRLINATSSRGKVKVNNNSLNKPFLEKTFYFFLGSKYVVFPFLFFKLIRLDSKMIISEGGSNTVNNLQVYLYCKLFKKKYIIWDLGKGYADFGNAILRRFYMRVYVFLLKHASYIYGYNSQSKNYFQDLGITENKIVILNNTIDTRKIKKVRSTFKTYISNELSEQIGKGYTFLIFVGALVRSKNIESCAELLKILGNKYFLIIVGDGDPLYKAELEETFKGTNHFFAGYKKNDQLLPYYSLASFSLLPGLGGLSINQSMAFGVPVLCKSADGAEKDLIITDETGYVYKDLNDASNYIHSKTHKDWKKMGHNAEEFLYSHHSVERMMDKFISYI